MALESGTTLLPCHKTGNCMYAHDERKLGQLRMYACCFHERQFGKLGGWRYLALGCYLLVLHVTVVCFVLEPCKTHYDFHLAPKWCSAAMHPPRRLEGHKLELIIWIALGRHRSLSLRLGPAQHLREEATVETVKVWRRGKRERVATTSTIPPAQVSQHSIACYAGSSVDMTPLPIAISGRLVQIASAYIFSILALAVVWAEEIKWFGTRPPTRVSGPRCSRVVKSHPRYKRCHDSAMYVPN
jgi:hypothetical protein